MNRSIFKTKRLILRGLGSQDYEAWLDAYCNGPKSQSKWDSNPVPLHKCTKRIFNKVRKKHNQLGKDDKYYRYYAFDKKNGEIVGLIDFDIFARGSLQFANFGYRIFNCHWGKGLGQEASAAGLRIGFKHLKLNRLEAAINLDNRKSIRLCKAIGMRKEGIKKRYWFENNQWVDHLIYVANPEDIGLKPSKPN